MDGSSEVTYHRESDPIHLSPHAERSRSMNVPSSVPHLSEAAGGFFRMKLKHYDNDGCVRFVTSCIRRRLPILTNDPFRRVVVDAIEGTMETETFLCKWTWLLGKNKPTRWVGYRFALPIGNVETRPSAVLRTRGFDLQDSCFDCAQHDGEREDGFPLSEPSKNP